MAAWAWLTTLPEPIRWAVGVVAVPALLGAAGLFMRWLAFRVAKQQTEVSAMATSADLLGRLMDAQDRVDDARAELADARRERRELRRRRDAAYADLKRCQEAVRRLAFDRDDEEGR